MNPFLTEGPTTLLSLPHFLRWFWCIPQGAEPFHKSHLNGAHACFQLTPPLLSLVACVHSDQGPLAQVASHTVPPGSE